jgi:hypothetical protein
MTMFQLTTWNVLHRIHAVNWSEAPVTQFPDERVRIAGITDFIATHLLPISTAIGLQEVSGDQLTSLRAVFTPDKATILTHEYPRLPKLKQPSPTTGSPLSDLKEYLVTIVPHPRAAKKIESETYDSDPGKGFLAVSVDDALTVINTHVSSGNRRDKQLARLVRAAESDTSVALLGDFNTEHDLLRATLITLSFGHSIMGGFTLTDLSAQPVTRIGSPGKSAGHTIDHVISKHPLTIEPGTVIDAGGLSDHQPVTARIHV